jgi:hypothetical protein
MSEQPRTGDDEVAPRERDLERRRRPARLFSPELAASESLRPFLIVYNRFHSVLRADPKEGPLLLVDAWWCAAGV